MRLGQLARKLEITTTDIVRHLADKDIVIKDHPNVKLQEENEQEVIEAFGGIKEEVPLPESTPSIDQDSPGETEVAEPQPEPKLIAEAPEDLISEDEVTEDKSQPQEPTEFADVEATEDSLAQEVPKKPSDPSIEEINEKPDDEAIEEAPHAPKTSMTVAEILALQSPDEDLDNESDENIALPEELKSVKVIKAPKVELPGLKVVGKIDLPEPIVKEESPAEEKEDNDADRESEHPKIIRHNRKNAKRKLSEEEWEARRLRNKKAKEKRLAKQKLKQKEQEEQRLKAIKEAHYKKKLQPVGTAKKPKKKAKSKQKQEQRPKPKTVLGKFWRWLNT